MSSPHHMSAKHPLSPPGHSGDGQGWAPVNTTVKARRPRTSKPKVKTGCRTCKIRRVKCDEMKPSCRRCLRFNGECDGYELDLARTASKIILPKPLAPIAPKMATSPISESPSPTLRHDLWPSLFASDPEYFYFRYFHDNTVSRLSGYLSEFLWDRLVLKACEKEPSIRHAVIAIGALHLALESGENLRGGTEPTSPYMGNKSAKPVSHHQFALQHYAKAIKQMRETMSEPRRDMRNTLIACLLCVCFENFYGNNNMHLDDHQTGLKLINGWLPQFMKNGVLPAHYVPGPRSPAPYIIEDELIHAFAGLDILMFANEEAAEVLSEQRPSMLEVCRLMPQTFLSVEEAKMYWDLTWRQTLHYIANSTGWTAILRLEDLDCHRPGELWDMPLCPDHLYTTHHNSSGREDDYLRGLVAWSDAFKPLFLDSQRPSGAVVTKDFLAATSLALQHKAYHLALAGTFRSEMYYDAHLKTFKEILALASSLLEHIQARQHATDCGSTVSGIGAPPASLERLVARCVYMTARTCRERTTRRHAITLLQNLSPGRDRSTPTVIVAGDGGALMARVATLGMEIEERRLEQGAFVPERARIRVVGTQVDGKARRGVLRYVKAKPQPGWEGIVEEVGLVW